MRKLFLIILALGTLQVIYTQSYQSFQTSATNPNWSQAYWIGPGHTPFFYWYEMDADTTIGAFNYGKLVYKTSGSSNYNGALRENSSRQILYIPKDSTNEMLIYDFSLQLNDTLFDVWCNRFGTMVQDTLKVTYLDSVQLGGDYYTHFILENLNEPGQIEWFESFGSKGDLVMHMPYLSVSGANYLSCFHNNQGLYYTTSQVMGFIGSETCYLINESYQVHWIEVFPNPVITDLYINFNETLNNFTVSIIDMNGKVLSTSGLLDNTLQVNHLLKGNYILRIEQGSNIYLSKFTKN